VDSHRVEPLGDCDLFLAPEDHGRLLLAVAERDVMDLQILLEFGVLPRLGQVIPQARVPLVRLPRFLHVSSAQHCELSSRSSYTAPWQNAILSELQSTYFAVFSGNRVRVR
jgi:hypothetical protein